MEKESLVEIYQGENGSLNIRVDDNKQTIWANQNEIAKIFDVNVRTINDHINNIFKTNEMNKEATIRKFRLVQKEGKIMVQREIEYYDLDVVLSVGYRVNSKNAIKFRQWANGILHKHIVNGWTINYNKLIINFNISWIPVFAGTTITELNGAVISREVRIQEIFSKINTYFTKTKDLLLKIIFSKNDRFNFRIIKIGKYE
ncbi:MAG: RhuM family protein [Rickettsiales bacterium]|nr:RhuM family protein [Rickettsiales bacterium]